MADQKIAQTSSEGQTEYIDKSDIGHAHVELGDDDKKDHMDYNRIDKEVAKVSTFHSLNLFLY